MKVAEVVQYLGVDHSTVTRWCASGVLKSAKNGKFYEVDAEAVRAKKAELSGHSMDYELEQKARLAKIKEREERKEKQREEAKQRRAEQRTQQQALEAKHLEALRKELAELKLQQELAIQQGKALPGPIAPIVTPPTPAVATSETTATAPETITPSASPVSQPSTPALTEREEQKQQEIEDIEELVKSLNLAPVKAERLKALLKGFNKHRADAALKAVQALIKIDEELERSGKYLEADQVRTDLTEYCTRLFRHLKSMVDVWGIKLHCSPEQVAVMQQDYELAVKRFYEELRGKLNV